jgi:hypothetical protein
VVAVGDDPEDIEVPAQDHGLSRLTRVRASGGIVALRDVGRTVVPVTLEHLTER